MPKKPKKTASQGYCKAVLEFWHKIWYFHIFPKPNIVSEIFFKNQKFFVIFLFKEMIPHFPPPFHSVKLQPAKLFSEDTDASLWQPPKLQ